MTDTCQAYAEDLSALLDGELAPERAAQVRAHAEACAHCGGLLARLARLDALLAGAAAPDVPASLRTRLEARMAAQAVGGAGSSDAHLRQTPTARAPRRAWLSRAAGAVAAAAAALALYLAVAGREPAPLSGAQAPVQVARPQTPPEPAAPPIAPVPVTPKAVARRAEPAAPAAIDLDALPDEDLGLALELETVEDFEEIANLELLELMLANEAS